MSLPLLIFHTSDLHFGAEDRAALDWFAKEVVQEKPALVICTGDLTMRGTAREFALAQCWLAGLAAPVHLEPGNHDVPYYWYPLRRMFAPYARYRALRTTLGPVAAEDPLALVSLKTVARAQWRLNWSKGWVRSRDLATTLHGLAAGAGKALRLVACHHPLIEDDLTKRSSTRGGKQALAALARGGAQAVLSGHVHDPFDRMVEFDGQPIRIIGAGTLSERIRSTPPSYNRLEWSPETGLQVEVRRQN
jgi:3',5'-cyclic AMP phosphodiesterase CpdA